MGAWRGHPIVKPGARVSAARRRVGVHPPRRRASAVVSSEAVRSVRRETPRLAPLLVPVGTADARPTGRRAARLDHF